MRFDESNEQKGCWIQFNPSEERGVREERTKEQRNITEIALHLYDNSFTLGRLHRTNEKSTRYYS